MTTPQNSSPIDDDVLEQAAEWFAILQDQSVTEQEKSAWQLWLKASAEHQRAWLSIEDISNTFHSASKESETVPVHEILSASKRSTPLANTSRFLSIVLIGFLSFFAWDAYSPFNLNGNVYATQVGETRFIELEDGSQIWLNTHTEIEVSFEQNLRAITLLHGEILIDTHKDNLHRPFVVDTEEGRMTALGTHFTVRYVDNKTTDLTVFEGAVKIDPELTSNNRVVKAGQRNSFDQSAIFDVQPANMASQAWSKGILLADNTPICEFLTELSRYSHDKIICSKEVEPIILVGSYSIKDINTVFTSLQSSVPVYIWQVSPGTWRVDKKK